MISRLSGFYPVWILGMMMTLVSSCAAKSPLQICELEIETPRGAVPLRVEVARTEKEQERGFMGRKEIPDGTGMIFAYESDQRMHFWMKDTPHPLSIAFIDSSGTIREMYDMTPFSLETISSERSVRFALEVPAGWFARAGVSVGDRLTERSLAAVAVSPRD